VNDAPVANSQTVTTDEDTPAVITLTASDVDGDPLTYSTKTQPAHGTLSGTPPNLVYHPATNYNGADSFTFTANDGQTNSQAATISITVNPVNDPPQLTVPGAVTVAEDEPFTFDTNQPISVADVDAGTGLLQLSLSVTNGTLTLGSTNGLLWLAGNDGSGNLVVSGSLEDLNGALAGLVYLGVTNFFGADTLMVSIDDLGHSGAGGNQTDSKTISITVTPVNDAPVLAALADQIVAEDTTLTVTATATDPDLPANTLTFSLAAAPAGMTIDPATGVITWTPT